jgi:hypothetical protein
MTSSKNRAKTSALKLEPKVFMIQRNFETSRNEFGESWWIFTENLSKMAGRRGSQGNHNPQVKKSQNTKISSVSGVGTSSSREARPLPAGINPATSYSLIEFAVTLDSLKTNAARRAFDLFAVTRSFRSASISSISSSSDLISPSSRLPDSLAAGEVSSSAGRAVPGSRTSGSAGRPAATSS